MDYQDVKIFEIITHKKGAKNLTKSVLASSSIEEARHILNSRDQIISIKELTTFEELKELLIL